MRMLFATLAGFAALLALAGTPSWAQLPGDAPLEPDPLLEPPDAQWLAQLGPETQSLKLSYEGPAHEVLNKAMAQLGPKGWMLLECSMPSQHPCRRIIAAAAPTGLPGDSPPLVLADWYRVPMPSAVGRVFLWPCVPGARYCVWFGQRRFSGTVCLNPKASRR